MEESLPIYKIDIRDLEHGVNKVSIVENPAIQENFLKFNKNENPYTFKLASDEQQKLIGALLIPDKPIYRYTEEMGEFYVVFTKEVIEEIARRYNSQGFATSFNLEHEKDVDNVIMQENWIVENSEYDKSRAFNLSYDVGTWVGVAHIDNAKLWQDVKDNFNGFSVELLSGLKFNKEEPKPTEKEMLEWLEECGEDIEDFGKEWEIIEETEDFAITSKPASESKYDNENYRTRYRYTGGAPKDTTRDFCRAMMTKHKNKIFRYEDINAMSFRKENSEFGTYSIWKYKGSFNCRHRWKKLLFKKIDATSNKKPPTPPNESIAETRTENLSKKNNNNLHYKQTTNKQMLEVKVQLEEQTSTTEGVALYTPTQIEVGATVYVGTDDGAEFAPEGSHELENGVTIVVGENGVISEIVEAEPAQEEEQQEELSKDLDINSIVEQVKESLNLKEVVAKEVKESFSTLTKDEEPKKQKNNFNRQFIPKLKQK